MEPDDAEAYADGDDNENHNEEDMDYEFDFTDPEPEVAEEGKNKDSHVRPIAQTFILHLFLNVFVEKDLESMPHRKVPQKTIPPELHGACGAETGPGPLRPLRPHSLDARRE